jgi:hypothetical protein
MARTESGSPEPSQDLVQEMPEERNPAEGDECAGLLHELGNLVNTLVLATRMLERQAPEGLRDQLHDIRQLGIDMATVMQRFHQNRHRRRARANPADRQRE